MPRTKKQKTTIIEPKTHRRISFQTIKGTKDILPEEQPHWEFVRDTVKKIAQEYGFSRIDTPIIEDVNVFVRGVGRDTDIVEKEMFVFKDKGGGTLCLRPENTASIARAYIEHGFATRVQPVKLYYLGSMFRYDQPQAGRRRQFEQFGFEVLGSASPASDAQMILIAVNILKSLGLTDLNIQLNSIGCPDCRSAYRETLLAYYQSQISRLCPDCKRRLRANPLRLLDCKEEKCQRLANQAPVLIDFLCEGCHDHFKAVLEYLDKLEIVYNLNPRLVRGLDYYTNTVFEIWPGKSGRREGARQAALGGGGRYNNLIESLGGNPTPGVGFSCGIERIILQLVERGVEVPPSSPKPAILLAQLGEFAKRKALVLFEELRGEGIYVAESFSRDSLKSQLKVADRLKVKLVLILGQREALEGTILIRDMETGIQELVNRDKAVTEVKKRLEKMRRG